MLVIKAGIVKTIKESRLAEYKKQGYEIFVPVPAAPAEAAKAQVKAQKPKAPVKK